MSKLDQCQLIDRKTGKEIPIEAIESILKYDKAQKRIYLENKFKANTITKIELEELIMMRYRTTDIKLKYNKFYKMNMNKAKPNTVTYSEYGKFIEMLNFISYKNQITHSNGKEIQRMDLCKYLGFKNIRGFNSFVKKLSDNKMLAELEMGGVNFLFINPAYAQRNMVLNHTIFTLFKNDLIEFLDDYQIKYLSMEDDDISISSVIPLQK